MRPLRWPVTLLSLVLALTSIPACGDGGAGSGSDGGPRDSGAARDDAGPAEDAGTESDAGPRDGGIDADEDGVPAPADCDDSDPNVHPGADELCNDVDDDCDGTTDEDAIDPSTFFRDADGDGYGGVLDPVTACDAPAGYVTNDDDCDDTDRETHPDALEICNVFDDDCDGVVDDGATDATTWYVDLDGDGFGTTATTIATCDLSPPAGYSDVSTDCDDTSASINPTAAELCSTVGIDDDCDGMIDEPSASGAITWYRDADRDTYGNAAATLASCTDPTTPTEAWVARAGDCDDAQASWYPGASDLSDDAIADSNCDGMDGDAAAVVFVASSASGCGCESVSSAGTRSTPFCSIGDGLSAAAARGLSGIVVANGVYSETVTLRSGIAITGGYVCNTIDGTTGLRRWTRSLPSATTIAAPAGSGTGVTMTGSGDVGAPLRIGTTVRLDGLQIRGPDMASVAGAESIALRLVGIADPSLVVLRNVRLTGGQGGHGTRGADGTLRACSVPGGGGGHRTSGDCGSDGGGEGGSGGFGGSPGPGGPAGASYCVAACGTLNWDGLSAGTAGWPGGSGRNGGGGPAGAGAASGTFSSSTGDWTPTHGGGGTAGQDGGGGGGGGQGGTRGQCACIDCCQNRWGAPGGAGGRGGCGGNGGTPGTSGGPSISLQLVRAQVMLESGVQIVHGAGGRGGDGGRGANGETGPGGGAGGSRYSWWCAATHHGAEGGGPGGSGGSGGGGGGGAAGNGGASWGIVRIGGGAGFSGSPSYVSGGTGGAAGTGGQGGRQGVTGVQAANGASGVAGPTESTLVIP